MLPENSYVIRLYKSSKTLFILVVLLSLISVATNFLLKGELTPFFKWDLYANAIPDQKQYSFLEIRYNDNKLLNFPHTWKEPEKLFFTNTMDLFIAIKKNHNEDPLMNYYKNDWLLRHTFFKDRFTGLKIFNDSSDIQQFPSWYKRYLSQHIGQPVDSIKIFEKKVEYKIDGSVKEISSELVYTIL